MPHIGFWLGCTGVLWLGALTSCLVLMRPPGCQLEFRVFALYQGHLGPLGLSAPSPSVAISLRLRSILLTQVFLNRSDFCVCLRKSLSRPQIALNRPISRFSQESRRSESLAIVPRNGEPLVIEILFAIFRGKTRPHCGLIGDGCSQLWAEKSKDVPGACRSRLLRGHKG